MSSKQMLGRRWGTACALVAVCGTWSCESGSDAADSDNGPSAGESNSGGAGDNSGVGNSGEGGSAAPAAPSGGGGDPGPDPTPPPAGSVPLFVLQGHIERTAVSCDDGESWVADASVDGALRCFEGGLDCDHRPDSATGIAYGNGWFVALSGWGAAGQIRRSRDGEVWETTGVSDALTGIAFGNDVFLAGGRLPLVGTVEGDDWMTGAESLNDTFSPRATAFSAVNGGTFFIVASNEVSEVGFSTDAGRSWSHPASWPMECGQFVQGMVASNDVVVIVQGNGSVCRSVDGGTTWTHHDLPAEQVTSRGGVFTGTEFQLWGGGQGSMGPPTRYSSADGSDWTATSASVPQDASIRAVARSADGSYVAVGAAWSGNYDQQLLLRSGDGGVTWTEASSYAGGHPVNYIAFGYGAKPAACP